jgi:glycosyltransferase involved in cell wall biosynthesis
MNWPKISIVTPSFNQGQYIEETILSVLSQNYPNLEYIIIDGGSTDDTVEIIKKYESRITYWVSEPDRGQSHAINKGLQKCTGEIFNWLNSDDWYMPGALFDVANAFRINSRAQFVSGYENHVEQSGMINLHTGTFINSNIEQKECIFLNKD